MGGVVFVLVRRLRRVVADEWVTLMSCCPSILEMGLERERWKGNAECMISCLSLNEAKDWCRGSGGFVNLR